MTSSQGLFPEPPFDPVGDAKRIIWGAIETYRPSHVFAMVSGGNDSIPAAHLAAQHPDFSGVVNLHTGWGIGATRRHAYTVVKAHGWPFLMYRPEAGNRYHELVLAYGFPGSFHHRKMYNRLKERSIEQLERDHRAYDEDGKPRPIILVTGVREQESTRRMGVVAEVNIEKNKPYRVWVAPIVHWSTQDKEQYMAAHGLPKNPVTEKLCISGECLCGSYASPGELEEIGFFFPKERRELRKLEVRVTERLGGKFRVVLHLATAITLAEFAALEIAIQGTGVMAQHNTKKRRLSFDYIETAVAPQAASWALAQYGQQEVEGVEVRAYNLRWGCDPPEPYILGDLRQQEMELDGPTTGTLCWSCDARRGVA